MPSSHLTLYFTIFLTNFVLFYTNCSAQFHNINPSSLKQQQRLGDCQACHLLAESFKKGLVRTARGKFEGGDAAWEEEKLKKYSRSEVRLVDLQEGLCEEVDDKYKDQCHLLAENSEEYIEAWWFNEEKQDEKEFFTYLCIDKMRHCCPKHHYGKECLPCLTNFNNVCSGNGKCKGDGTRKGSGKCACEAPYSGETCDKCAHGYFESYKDQLKLLCSPCHIACLDGCSQGGPKGCSVCKSGWIFDTERGCVDIDECLAADTCTANQFCVNDDGSHTCLDCDKSCSGCYGDGPDMCDKCAKGYSLKENVCLKDNADEHQIDGLTHSRYITYVGLIVATCILLQKSKSLAGFVGMLVLAYITSAEYYCMINGHKHGLIDLDSLDLTKLIST